MPPRGFFWGGRIFPCLIFFGGGVLACGMRPKRKTLWHFKKRNFLKPQRKNIFSSLDADMRGRFTFLPRSRFGELFLMEQKARFAERAFCLPRWPVAHGAGRALCYTAVNNFKRIRHKGGNRAAAFRAWALRRNRRSARTTRIASMLGETTISPRIRPRRLELLSPRPPWGRSLRISLKRCSQTWRLPRPKSAAGR